MRTRAQSAPNFQARVKCRILSPSIKGENLYLGGVKNFGTAVARKILIDLFGTTTTSPND